MKHGIFLMAVILILAACSPNTPQPTATATPIPSFTPAPILTPTPTSTETPTPESTSEVQKRIGDKFKMVESPNGDYKVIEGDTNEILKIYEDGHSTIDRVIKKEPVTVTFSNKDIIGKGENEFWAAGWKLTQTESGEMVWEVVPGERITGEEWAKDHLPHFQESEYATRRAYIDEIWEKYNIRKLFPDNLDKVTPGGYLVRSFRNDNGVGNHTSLYPIPQEPYNDTSDLAKSDRTEKPQKSSVVLWKNGWTYNEMGKDEEGNEWGSVAFPVSVVEPKEAIKSGEPEIFTAFIWEDEASYFDNKGNKTETPVSISQIFDRNLYQKYGVWLALYHTDTKATTWSGSKRMARWFTKEQQYGLDVIKSLPKIHIFHVPPPSINIIPKKLEDIPFMSEYNSG